MKKYDLTDTLPAVSELAFATAHMGSLFSKISEEEGGRLILTGLERGINFVETSAQMYRPYSRIKKALDEFSGEVILSVRSTAADYSNMMKSIEDARSALERDSIDLFMLHINKTTNNLVKDKADALNALQEAKRKGWIRAVGLSTHSVKIMLQAVEVDFIDVLNPAVNRFGLGIIEGELSEMLKAIQIGQEAGKVAYAMKALAGGTLASKREESLNFVRAISGISSIAVGMSNLEELEANLKWLEVGKFLSTHEIPTTLTRSYDRTVKRFSNFCKGCGICINNCPAQAMNLESGYVQIDEVKCILCGYCTSACPHFALRLD